jgi:hypothetical protein
MAPARAAIVNIFDTSVGTVLGPMLWAHFTMREGVHAKCACWEAWQW